LNEIWSFTFFTFYDLFGVLLFLGKVVFLLVKLKNGKRTGNYGVWKETLLEGKGHAKIFIFLSKSPF